MEMTVLVERLADDKYRASTGFPVVMESEGRSPNEAVERQEKCSTYSHYSEMSGLR